MFKPELVTAMNDRPLKLIRTKDMSDNDSAMSDDDLMILAAAGRTDAFEILVNRHYGSVCAAAVQYLGDRPLAQDAVQETFLSLWTRRESYTPSGRLKSYLFTVLFNCCRMQLRKRKSEAKRNDSFGAERAALDESPEIPLETFIKLEQKRRVQQKLSTLPEKQRRVLICRYGQNMSLAQTAETLDIPINTAKTQAARALKLLYKKMKGKLS